MDASFVVDSLARWGHFLFGVTWIGILYYFNFVQGEYFKEADAPARTDAVVKLVPRALWWFRWGAMFTFITGCIMLGIRGSAVTVDIIVGATMGTLMFLNVWLIIWPAQKIVIASNEQVKAGGEALPQAGTAGPKAALASRTNTLFSIPMLFFMGASAHYSHGSVHNHGWALVVALAIVLIIQLNGMFGKQGPMSSVAGVIHLGLLLTAALWGALTYI